MTSASKRKLALRTVVAKAAARDRRSYSAIRLRDEAKRFIRQLQDRYDRGEALTDIEFSFLEFDRHQTKKPALPSIEETLSYLDGSTRRAVGGNIYQTPIVWLAGGPNARPH